MLSEHVFCNNVKDSCVIFCQILSLVYLLPLFHMQILFTIDIGR